MCHDKSKKACLPCLFWTRRNASWCIAFSIRRTLVHQRQREGDRGSLLGDAGQGQRATKINGDAPSDGESEARASRLSRAGLIHSIEDRKSTRLNSSQLESRMPS